MSEDFLRILEDAQTMEHIDLDNYCLEEEKGGEETAFVKTLATNTVVKILDYAYIGEYYGPDRANACFALAEMLKHNTTLEQLYIRFETNYGFVENIYQALAENNSVKTVSLGVGSVAPDTLANYLQSTTSLEDLTLSSNLRTMTLAVTSALFACRTLRKLSLSEQLSNDGYRHFMTGLLGTHLTEFSISHINLNEHNALLFAHAVTCMPLRKLSLSDIIIPPVGIVSLAEALSDHQSIHEFQLTLMKLDHDGGMALGAMFDQNGTLESVQLSLLKPLDTIASQSITRGIATHPRLYSASISNVYLDADHALLLVQSETIESLFIHRIHEHMTRDIVDTFATGIRENTILRRLSLSWFHKTRIDCVPILKALECHPTLQDVRLTMHSVEECREYVDVLCRILEHNQVLDSLSVSQLWMTKDERLTICKSLQKNIAMTYVGFMSSEEAREITARNKTYKDIVPTVRALGGSLDKFPAIFQEKLKHLRAPERPLLDRDTMSVVLDYLK